MTEYVKQWVVCPTCKGQPDQERFRVYGGKCYICDGAGGKNSRLQRFLALGGPLDLKHVTEAEAGDRYVRFNAAHGGLWTGTRRAKLFSCVLVFKDLVAG